MSGSEGAGRREVAYRIFAAEFDDADFAYSESDEERAPNYVITPTGARANRVFVVGVLTEVESVSEDVLRARVVDPTGAFVLYAGQYQPDEQAFLEGAEPPTFVAVTGKARTFSPDDSDQVFTSIRPESISQVDAETRDRWTVQAAEQSLDRIARMAGALVSDDNAEDLIEQGVEEGLAQGIELAREHYGTTPAYLDSVRELALDAARVVAGEQDEVVADTTAPGFDGDVTAADLLAGLPDPGETMSGDSRTVEATIASEATEIDSSGEETAPETTAESGSGTEYGSSDEGVDEPEAEPDTGQESDTAGTPEQPESTEPASRPTETPGGDPEDDQPAVEADTVSGDTATGESATDDLGDFEPDEEFELEEETRQEIESEYGTEFQSGTEVDEPGNADIETPDPEPSAAEESSGTEPAGTEPATDAADTGEPAVGDLEESERSTEEKTPAAAESDGETAEETDGESGLEGPDEVQEAVVGLMDELDDGGGADREEIIAEMETRYGLAAAEVEDAIQSALMDGQCYEPDDSSLKSI